MQHNLSVTFSSCMTDSYRVAHPWQRKMNSQLVQPNTGSVALDLWIKGCLKSHNSLLVLLEIRLYSSGTGLCFHWLKISTQNDTFYIIRAFILSFVTWLSPRMSRAFLRPWPTTLPMTCNISSSTSQNQNNRKHATENSLNRTNFQYICLLFFYLIYLNPMLRTFTNLPMVLGEFWSLVVARKVQDEFQGLILSSPHLWLAYPS